MDPLLLPLSCSLSPGDVLRAVRGEEMPFALVGRWAGSAAVVGFGPSRVVVGADALRAVDDVPSGVWPASPFVGGGWFGWLGFGLSWEIEELPPAPPRPVPCSDAVVGFYESVLRLDGDGQWWFEALADTPAARSRLSLISHLLAEPVRPATWSLEGMTLHGGAAAAHRAAVADCVERIAAGELFQANLCLRLDGRLEGSAADAFADASARLQPSYGAFFGRPDGAVLSFSPELFLRRTGREVVTAPIKGTAPRVCGDVGARDELLASAKDAAEHVMIVDLMRNDLGRVAEYGTVHAPPVPDAEPHPGLWHLVSHVRARLRGDVGDGELLRATFPPGSVTGAPKVQSLKVISTLEGTAREAYTGAIGYVSPAAGLELNVAIRTLEVRGTDAWLGCGGGIVADSDPDAELREALGKARPIVEALGATVPEPSTAPLLELSARTLSRPDPSAGIFETIAVVDGSAVELARHLARLATSARDVYGGLPLPADLETRIVSEAATAGAGRHRLRVVLAPGRAPEVSVAPAGPAADVLLDPVVLAGGLGPHKWADRTPHLSTEAPGRAGLVCDLDGTALEATFANIWAIEGDRLVTPPADGRILPGVTRARLLEGASAAGLTLAEEPLPLDRLRKADGLIVTSSIRLAAAAALTGTSPTERARAVAEAVRKHLTPPIRSVPVGPVAQLVRAADS